MIDEKPTYEELLKWHDEDEKTAKVVEVFKSFAVCAGMMFTFGIIADFAKIGAATVFDAWKLSQESITACNAFLQMGISFVYAYMIWHFALVVLFTYKEDINAFGGKWKAFKAWCKRDEESTQEVKE